MSESKTFLQTCIPENSSILKRVTEILAGAFSFGRSIDTVGQYSDIDFTALFQASRSDLAEAKKMLGLKPLPEVVNRLAEMMALHGLSIFVLKFWIESKDLISSEFARMPSDYKALFGYLTKDRTDDELALIQVWIVRSCVIDRAFQNVLAINTPEIEGSILIADIKQLSESMDQMLDMLADPESLAQITEEDISRWANAAINSAPRYLAVKGKLS